MITPLDTTSRKRYPNSIPRKDFRGELFQCRQGIGPIEASWNWNHQHRNRLRPSNAAKALAPLKLK